MNGGSDKERHLPVLVLGTIALIGLTGFLWWVSDLTAGPEYGGRYDVPSINGAAWNLFVICVAGAVVLTLVSLAQLGDRFAARRGSRSPHDTQTPPGQLSGAISLKKEES